MTASESDAAQLPYLLFVGDGPLKQPLERLAGVHNGTSIRFLGFKNQTELPAFYDLCDVFVLPSRFEPWGLVVNEAMNAGKPVIVSDRVGAGADLVGHADNGWVFPAGNVTALAKALQGACNLRSGLERMGKRSLARINKWDYDADYRGLQQAVAAVTTVHKTVG